MTHGIVAAPHHLASEAGAEVLRAGGNAIDAAVAANAVLCVVYPHMTSVGGDLFAMVWPAGAEAPVGLAGAGRSGSLATTEEVRGRGHAAMPPNGPLTVTVPGTVEAWGRLVERFGRLGLEPLMAPAAALARDGWVVSQGVADQLAANADWLLADPESARLLPPVKAGMALRSPELASTLEEIGRHGFNGFYRGQTARRIAAALERRGGLVTAADLASHRSQWVEPVPLDYQDLVVYEMPPPTQGLAAAGLLVRLRDSPKEPGLEFARHLLRAHDAVYPLRDRLITDPDFAQVPVEPFLDPTRAGVGRTDPPPDGDTVYLCTADEEGNAVSLIQSVANAFGSGVIAEGTGVLLQNRGVYFSLDAAHVNRLEPGKRTMHTLIPAMAARGGRCWAVFGSMGAVAQPQFHVQLLANLADRALDPQGAVSEPRIRVAADARTLLVEADHAAAREILRSDLVTQAIPPRSSQMGHAQALVIDAPGVWRGGADPRADGSVVIV
ncbi:MAG: gamma-glutamyltransferase [Candidatus Dormibacteraeota bacterium]|nr:gamma-glutamyltransferase [Candidatus Dormibacteraeota bacterium]